MSPITAGTRTWLTEADCDLDAFRSLVEQSTDPADHPLAERVEQNVPLYDSSRLRDLAATAEGRRDVQSELVRALLDGPGIVVLKGAFPDEAIVDRASDAFRALIEEERASGAARGDHFAKPGANDRVWNALDKVAVRAPEAFADTTTQRHPGADLGGLAGSGLPGHLAGQRGQPGRRGTDRAP